MPIIKARANRVRIVRHICRFQEPNRDTLLAYARFIGDSADYILNQLIETTLARDREFTIWRAEHPADERPASPSAPAAAPSATEPARRA